jgi:asparagine synthase (glutamine-hydrolysing)
MSAQAGVLFRDRRPIEASLVTSIGDSLDEFGPDRAGQHIGPGLAIVHRALHVTPEDRLERQPIVSRAGHVMTWDGRLDNRSELLLALWRTLGDDTSDAGLAMAAYEAWGRGAFARLIGDWSLVIWDAAEQCVLLVSDYMGIRPLYYCQLPDALSWATTIETLLRLHGYQDALEDSFVVGCLTATSPPHVTPYKNIFAVPPGTVLSVTLSGRTTVTPFWTFESVAGRKTSTDYAGELRSIFIDAVQSRLRSATPVWAQLSGGLDSSCIVCAADVLVRQRLVGAPALQTISYYTDGSPEMDERRFMACVEEQRDARSHYLQLDDSLNSNNSARSWVTPNHPSGSTLETYRLIDRSGGRVLLTGSAGDSVMGNCLDYHYDVAGSLQRGHLVEATRLGRRRALAAQRPIAGVMYDAARELLPARFGVRRFVQHRLGAPGAARSGSDEHFANTFLVRAEYADWWRSEVGRQLISYASFPDVSQRRPASELMRVAEGRLAQAPSDEPAPSLAHPYLHRPLVEFMLNVPATVVVPPGEARGLMRRAFAPFVPPRIISRISKGYAPPFFARNLRATVAKWLDHPEQLQLVGLPCIDTPRLMTYLASVQNNSCKRIHTLCVLVKLEEWLDARARRNSESAVDGRYVVR